MSYQIVGDLLSRTNHVLAKGLANKEICNVLIDEMSRKGWTNLKIVKESNNEHQEDSISTS